MSKELKEKLGGIDSVLDKIIKGQESELIEDEEKEEVTETEDSKETEEIEKSEEEVTEEVEDEEIEKSEDETLMNLEDVVSAVIEKVEEKFSGEIGEIKETMKSIVSTMRKQTDVMEKMDSEKEGESDSINKSIGEINEKLGKLSNFRKSVTDPKKVNIFERFTNEPDVNTLSKSQKATILADAIEAGNTAIGVNDVTNAEIGAPISAAAIKVIKTAIK